MNKVAKILSLLSLLFLVAGIGLFLLNSSTFRDRQKEISEIKQQRRASFSENIKRKRGEISLDLQKKKGENAILIEKTRGIRKRIATIPLQLDVLEKKGKSLESQVDIRRQDLRKMQEVEKFFIRQASLRKTLSDLRRGRFVLRDEVNSLSADIIKQKKEVEKFQKSLADEKKGNSRSGIQTRIYSIHPNWGFVTLEDGRNKGIVKGSFLKVKREGKEIARLRVIFAGGEMATAELKESYKASLLVGDEVTSDL